MRFIADFHIHSRYSRATSKEMRLEVVARFAKLKGIQLLGTGDFTHPTYFLEIKSQLAPAENGLYTLKDDRNGTRFILTTEVSNIFSQKDKRNRRVHTLIFAPSIQVVGKINERLGRMGKLGSDGRPIFGFPVKDLVKVVLDCSPDCLLIPAHAWTPWFSVFGANSGFDSLDECFGEQRRFIAAIETGLSSDPGMNWRISALDRITLISNSDAHSPEKIGREANCFDCDLDYAAIISAIKKKDSKKFLSTIEFFPEEGKYHFDGHRNCNVLFSPKETKTHKGICPVCGRKLTVGVMSRVEELADRPEGYKPADAIPAVHLIPLREIIAEALGVGVESVSVEREYFKMVEKGASEYKILMDLPLEELMRCASPRVAEGIMRVREGKVKIVPGYDGVFGKIQIFDESEKEETGQEESKQLSLF
jgi:uncharacterized protein (TIGR00375 family)